LALALHDHVTPSLPSFASDRPRRVTVVGEGIVVEEKLLHLRKPALCEANFLNDT
jgi:hypothetical protein